MVVQWDDDGKTFRWQVPHLIAEDLKDGVLDVVATSTRLPAAKKKGKKGKQSEEDILKAMSAYTAGNFKAQFCKEGDKKPIGKLSWYGPTKKDASRMGWRQVCQVQTGEDFCNRSAYHAVCSMAAAGSKLSEHMPNISEKVFCGALYEARKLLCDSGWAWDTSLMNLHEFFKITKPAILNSTEWEAYHARKGNLM